MEKPELRITPKKYTGESTVISMRLAKDMLKDVDAIAADTGRTRNEILQLCMEFAMQHIRVEEIREKSAEDPSLAELAGSSERKGMRRNGNY